MAIGNPITLTSNVASKTISVIATAGQTLFTVTGGYRINQLAVFRNGVRLLDSRDYEARNGSTVTLLSAATVGDALEFQVFDDFRVADAIVSAESEQTIQGNLNVAGILTATDLSVTDLSLRHLTATGISTVSDTTQSTTTTSGAFIVSGGVGVAKNLFVGGSMNVAGTLTYEDVTNSETAGITTTGGLVVTGLGATFGSGVGIADSIYHIDDSNTAIRFPAADTFTVETGGSEALRVDSSQNTTFGTTSESSTSVNITASTSGNCLLSFNDTNSGQGGIRYFHSTDHMQFHTADAEKVRITSDGDVGIGTEAPETPRGNKGLEVAGTTGAEIVATRYDDNLADGDFIGGFVFKNLDAGGTPNHFAGMYAKANGTAGSMDLHFSSDRAQYEADTSDLTIRGGNVGINTTTPTSVFDVQVNTLAGINFTNQGQAAIIDFRANNVESAGRIRVAEASGGGAMLFNTKTTGGTITESFRVDTSQRLLIGSTSARGIGHGTAAAFEIEGTSATVFASVVKNSNDAYGSSIALGKTRGTSVGSNTSVNSGDEIGSIRFAAADGTDVQTRAAQITAAVDGTPGSNDMPGRLIFSTTADGAASPTERLRIDSSGRTTVFNGGSNQASEFNAGANQFVITHNDNCGLTIDSTSSTSGSIHFADGPTGNESYRGIIEYDHSIDSMKLYTSATERISITSVGTFHFKNGAMIENGIVDTTARTGTQAVNLDNGMVHYFTSSATGTWKPNFRVNSTNTLNGAMSNGDICSPTMVVNKSNTGHYADSVQVDGTDRTIEWLGGAPTAGGGNNTFDVYNYTIIKTADDTFIVFGSVSTYE